MIGIQNMHAFYFQWPWALLALLLIPLWWLWYAQMQKRTWQQALRFSYTSVVAHLKLQPTGWRRLRYPVGVSFLMVCLILTMARPTVVAQVAKESVDIMMVLDISLSMLAKDISPNRLNAAKEAGIDFIKSLPDNTRIGLEVFAGDHYVLSPPTEKHTEVIAYLRNLQEKDAKPRTEVGSALHTALGVLQAQRNQSLNQQQQKAEQQKKSGDTPLPIRPPGQVIVLLSDGDSHEGYPWLLAAQEAKKAKVGIYTIGVGSNEGTTINYQGFELPVLFSETTLREIARLAGGEYFRVADKSDLHQVYDQVRTRSIHYEEQSIELGFVLAALGLLILAATLSKPGI